LMIQEKMKAQSWEIIFQTEGGIDPVSWLPLRSLRTTNKENHGKHNVFCSTCCINDYIIMCRACWNPSNS
jgi:hypothetical protein